MYDDLSPLAQHVGRHMAEQCTDGLPRLFADDLLDAFADENPRSLGVALAELKAAGLVTLKSLIGPKLPRIRTTTALFVACDAAITGHDPVADSVVLARMLIENPGLGGNARNVEAATGWSRRRFNPAFALVLPAIDERRVSKSVQHDYPAMAVVVTPDDEIALRRYVKANT